MTADLHIHSIHSDGTFTPLEIIKAAQEFNLHAIAIADHDTVSATEETIEQARGKIEVIPAIEMSTELRKIDIHILGYFIDHTDGKLLSYCEQFKKHRLERAKKIIEKLGQDDIKLDFERIKEVVQGGSLGRPHIAEALIKHGYVNSMSEAFIRYLGYHSPYYVPKKKIHPKAAMKKIKQWRGIAVIAHAGTLNNESLIYELIDDGAQGIEVWHPDHNRAWQEKLTRIALENNLVMTGGSDFHGFCGTYAQIRKYGCGDEEVQKLKAMAEKRCT